MRPLLLLACAVLASAADDWERARILIPPLRPTPGEPVAVSRVDATLAVTGPNALTTLRVAVTNRGSQRAEAVMVLPIPPAAAVTRLDLTGPGGHLPGKLLPAAEARATYQSIVQRMRDPALAEFAGSALIRTSVFPVDPGQTQVVTLAWEELLAPTGDRVEWSLPRAERMDQGVPWTFAAEIRDPAVTAVAAPGQPWVAVQGKDGAWRLGGGAGDRPLAAGPLTLAWTRAATGTMVFAVPDGAAGGCFLMLAPAPAKAAGPAIGRDVSIVIDRSGSMAGDKWRQTVAAVIQLINGLEDGAGRPADRLDLLVFNEGVDRFAAGPQVVDDRVRREAEAWLKALRPMGGTNLHAALADALRPAVAPGRLPVVLLLSDGLPTIGQTAESAIRALVAQDAGRRRILAAGIGADVNAPLLDALGAASRGRHRPVPPGGDVELAVADLGRALGHPVMTDLRLEGGAGRLLDVEPQTLPDLSAGDQLVLLGRYAGTAPVAITVAGAGGGRIQAILDPAMASPAHAAVARMWAARRIAALLRRIRDLGADGRTDSPEVRELVASVVDLSTTYGVMTEYTAFLAAEPAAPAAALRDRAEGVAREQMAKRTGLEALAGSGNIQRLGAGVDQAVNDGYVDAGYRTLPAAPVQLAGDRALWRQQRHWVDPAAAGRPPTRTVQVGSTEWIALAERLRTRHRQALLAQDGEILLADGSDIVLIHP